MSDAPPPPPPMAAFPPLPPPLPKEGSSWSTVIALLLILVVVGLVIAFVVWVRRSPKSPPAVVPPVATPTPTKPVVGAPGGSSSAILPTFTLEPRLTSDEFMPIFQKAYTEYFDLLNKINEDPSLMPSFRDFNVPEFLSKHPDARPLMVYAKFFIDHSLEYTAHRRKVEDYVQTKLMTFHDKNSVLVGIQFAFLAAITYYTLYPSLMNDCLVREQCGVPADVLPLSSTMFKVQLKQKISLAAKAAMAEPLKGWIEAFHKRWFDPAVYSSSFIADLPNFQALVDMARFVQGQWSSLNTLLVNSPNELNNMLASMGDLQLLTKMWTISMMYCYKYK